MLPIPAMRSQHRHDDLVHHDGPAPPPPFVQHPAVGSHIDQHLVEAGRDLRNRGQQLEDAVAGRRDTVLVQRDDLPGFAHAPHPRDHPRCGVMVAMSASTVVSYPLVEHTLDNGLRVVVNPDPGVPCVAVNIWYNVGSRHEKVGRTGFAHLFEHLMFQGSAHVASGEHLTALQAVGGRVNATTWFDRTNYFEMVPVGAVDLALWLEADRLGTLLDAVTQDNLDNQREVVKEEKRQRYDNVPYGDLTHHLFGLAFPPGHPYHHTTIGSMADLDAATLDDVHSFFAAHYHPNNAVITLSGDITPDDAIERVTRFFGHLTPGDLPAAPDQPALSPLTGQPTVEIPAEVPAHAVCHAWRLPAIDDPAYDAVALALSILGDGLSARLEQALVRTTEVAEQAGSGTIGLIGGNSVGYATAHARPGVGPEALAEALLAEVSRMATEGPTDREVSRAHAQYSRSVLSHLAALDSRADEISRLTTLRGDPTLVNQRLGEVLRHDARSIAAAAGTWLQPDNRLTVTHRKES